jgi:uroporphyrinogen decarboxylase
MSVGITSEHLRLAGKLVEKARRHGGLAPLDIGRFWADQEVAMADPFGRNIPQVPLGVLPTRECLFAELGVAEDWYRLYHDEAWCAALSKAFNDKSERIIGRRLLNESVSDPAKCYPATKTLADVFEARNVWNNESYWLQESAHNEDELKALLDRVDARDIRGFILPPDWHEEKARLMALGVKPPPYRMQRGPVTFAMSIYGVERTIYLLMDNPDLAARLRDTILRVMLEIARVLDEETGCTPETSPRGFAFNDDNCAMLTPELYEFFGAPILKGVFNRYAPGPNDRRYQHSDSDMEHLLPILGRLGLNRVNFGPKVMVRDIRRHLPRAVIDGELAPYTLMRNEEVHIVAEFLRDFEMAREERGLVFSTAGSINNGSRLSSFRLIMAAIQEFGRYDR